MVRALQGLGFGGFRVSRFLFLGFWGLGFQGFSVQGFGV